MSRPRVSETHFPCGHEREFHGDARGKCRECNRLRSAAYYAANKSYYLDYQRQKRGTKKR